MEFILQIIVTAMVLTSSIFGSGSDNAITNPSVESVEIGLAEISPRGESGGFAVPASGCSYLPAKHGESGPCVGYPAITVEPPLVRSGEDVSVTWKIGGHTNCVLSGKDIAGPVASDSSQSVTLNSEITFGIVCDDGSATAVGKILPVIQET